MWSLFLSLEADLADKEDIHRILVLTAVHFDCLLRYSAIVTFKSMLHHISLEVEHLTNLCLSGLSHECSFTLKQV